MTFTVATFCPISRTRLTLVCLSTQSPNGSLGQAKKGVNHYRYCYFLSEDMHLLSCQMQLSAWLAQSKQSERMLQYSNSSFLTTLFEKVEVYRDKVLFIWIDEWSLDSKQLWRSATYTKPILSILSQSDWEETDVTPYTWLLSWEHMSVHKSTTSSSCSKSLSLEQK